MSSLRFILILVFVLDQTARGQAVAPINKLRQLKGDVTLTSPATGQVLTYNSVTGRWANTSTLPRLIVGTDLVGSSSGKLVIGATGADTRLLIGQSGGAGTGGLGITWQYHATEALGKAMLDTLGNQPFLIHSTSTGWLGVRTATRVGTTDLSVGAGGIGTTGSVAGASLRITNGSNHLSLFIGETLTANRTLTFVTGDADRTLTLSGNPILGGVKIYTGTGSPEGVVAAQAGSLYINESAGVGTTLWVKESGGGDPTGWIAK